MASSDDLLLLFRVHRFFTSLNPVVSLLLLLQKRMHTLMTWPLPFKRQRLLSPLKPAVFFPLLPQKRMHTLMTWSLRRT